MERLTVAEKGVGRGGGKGWGSCGEGPLLIPTYCLRMWSLVFWGRTEGMARILLIPPPPTPKP